MSRYQDQKGAYGPEVREALRASDPIMRRLIDVHSNSDPETWRRCGPTTDPSETLLRVVGQQGSTSAARAILGRLSALFSDRLPAYSDDEVRERLMAVEGIGPWSADMFLLRELGRPDVLPSEDVGVRKAVQRAYGLPAPPTPAEVNLLGEKWRLHRSLVAAYLFDSLAHATEPTRAEQKPDSPTF